MRDQFDYEVIGTNTFLTYTAPESEYDSFALKMLENNQLEELLPFSSIQENLDKKIRYIVTSYEPLKAYMTRPLPYLKILNILESIARAALEAEEYMLYMEGLVFDPAYMFADIRTGKTKLIYLPLRGLEKIDILQFIRGILGSVLYEAPEESSAVLRLSNDINAGRIVTIEQLLSAILELKNTQEKSAVAARKLVDRDVETGKAHILDGAGSRREEGRNPASAAATVTPAAAVSPVPMSGTEGKETKKKGFGFFGGEKKEKEDAKAEKKKGKRDQPLTPRFAIPGVESENIVSAEPEERIADVPVSVTEPKEKKSIFGGHKKKEKKDPSAIKSVTVPPRPEAAAIPEPLGGKEEPHLDFGMTIIRQAEEEFATVMSEEELGIPYLLRCSNGQKLYLEKDVNKIGHESSYVDLYIGDNMRISRNHAEIVRRGSGWAIKDNNSKNHTYVNKQMVTAGTLVTLSEGDTVELANEKFEFHEG